MCQRSSGLKPYAIFWGNRSEPCKALSPNELAHKVGLRYTENPEGIIRIVFTTSPVIARQAVLADHCWVVHTHAQPKQFMLNFIDDPIIEILKINPKLKICLLGKTNTSFVRTVAHLKRHFASVWAPFMSERVLHRNLQMTEDFTEASTGVEECTRNMDATLKELYLCLTNPKEKIYQKSLNHEQLGQEQILKALSRF